MEEWRDVVGYEWKYKVSSLGNIMSFSKVKKWGVLKHLYSHDWYPKVVLCKYNTIKHLFIHRIVAITFIDNPLNKPFINHIDWIKDNNAISNLEWCTASENEYHKYRVLWYKISDERRRIAANTCVVRDSKRVCQYSLDGKFIKERFSQADAGRTLGIHPWNISNCCRWVYGHSGWFKRAFPE